MNSTVWWKSKTLWMSVIALIASLAQAKWGLIIDGPTQGAILAIIFIILRLDTHGSITVTKSADPVKEAKAYAEQTVETAEKADMAVVNAEANVQDLKKSEEK
jgi:uncharacterized membrane protein